MQLRNVYYRISEILRGITDIKKGNNYRGNMEKRTKEYSL